MGRVFNTTEDFLKKAVLVHGDKYDYSEAKYISSQSKVTIICPLHNNFTQTPNNHLKGAGCPECGKQFRFINRSKNRVFEKFRTLVQPEEYKLIPLTKDKFTKVDNEDFERLKDINWCISQGYAFNDTLGFIHRFIMDAPSRLHVDHINHDTLDNRKINLRLASTTQNSANQKPRKGSSEYKGVSWHSKRNKWRSRVSLEGKEFHLGQYDTEKEAGKAYDKKALELWGDFAYLNFPELKEEYLKELEN